MKKQIHLLLLVFGFHNVSHPSRIFSAASPLSDVQSSASLAEYTLECAAELMNM